jgi:hypothetical protein
MTPVPIAGPAPVARRLAGEIADFAQQLVG